MLKEPLWTVADLGHHFSMSAQHLASWAGRYPLPEPNTTMINNQGLYFNSNSARAAKKKYKRSALLTWFKETKAKVEANKLKD